MKAKIVRNDDGQFWGINFRCPGCIAYGLAGGVTLPVNWLPPGETLAPVAHAGMDHWDFNGDFEHPTFSPSVLRHWTRPADGDEPEVRYVCHSFVRNGRIEFLEDCTHPLVGQTVDLPDLADGVFIT